MALGLRLTPDEGRAKNDAITALLTGQSATSAKGK